MNLIDVMRRECVSVGQTFADKDAVLQALASLAKSGPISDAVSEETLLEALRNREELGTTGFGEGIAIPHCRLENVDEFVVGLITAPEGVDFGALDGKPVRLFVFIIAPARESDEHIRLLSAISQVLMIPGATDEIIAAGSSEAAAESFLRHVRDEVDTKDHAGHNLFHVFVQDEEMFHQLLQVFSGTEASVTVLETQPASSYLRKTPLFAGFWTDEADLFDRLIVAMVGKKMTNEVIRRIERIAGNLDEQSGVLLTVQDIFYSAGSLNA